MDHVEGSDVREAMKAMTIATSDDMQVDSSDVVKEPTMEELEVIAPMMKNADSSDVLKDSAMEKLKTIATRNLNSSKVVEELAMEDKLSPADTTWGKKIHVPWGPLKGYTYLADGTKVRCQCIGCEFKRDRFRCKPQAKFVKEGDIIYFSWSK